jgi:hypothetical protein
MISIEHWWNDSDRWKPETLREEPLPVPLRLPLISHGTHLGLNPILRDERTSTDRLLPVYFPHRPGHPGHPLRLEDVGELYGDAVFLSAIWTYLGLRPSPYKQDTGLQVRSKDSQVKTQLVLWIFILFKVTTCFGLYHQAIIRSQVNSRIWGSYTL